MIRIRRSEEVPAALNSAAVAEARQAIAKIALNGKPMSAQFPSLWGNKEVRQALWIMQNKKCGYCERRRDVNRESDIDHFRPKAEVALAPDHKGYWWLAYDWKNLLFSCRHCNQSYKLNHFPIPDESRRVDSEAKELRSEHAYLIDPCNVDDDPESCFTYFVQELKLAKDETETLVYVQPRPDDEWNKERASRTIEVLKLNRKELLEERGKCVEKLKLLAGKMHYGKYLMDEAKVNEVAIQIRQATRSSQPFAGFCRAYFRNIGFGDYVSRE
jgi:uncharacterized protein (TIGR02646 family)